MSKDTKKYIMNVVGTRVKNYIYIYIQTKGCWEE